MSEHERLVSQSFSSYSTPEIEYDDRYNHMRSPTAGPSLSTSRCCDTESTCEMNEKLKREVSLMSNTATLMHLLKGNIGPAVLAIPSAFANAGLLVGSIALPVMCLVTIHCMNVLVNCHRKLCERNSCTFLDFDEVAEKAFLNGPNCMRNKAKYVKSAVNLFLLTTQIGFCCVYCIFIAENIQQFIKGITNEAVVVHIDTVMIAVYPIVVLFNMIRQLKHLAIASAAANLLQVTGLAIIFYNILIDLPPTWTRPATADITRLPLFFGTAIYAFEGIGLILPLQKDTKDQTAFGGCFGVLNTGMVIVGAFYFASGFFGFLKFGNDVKGSITLNLPSTPLYESVQLMLTIAVFPLYALQLYVPISIIAPFMRNKLNLEESSCMYTVADMALRASLVTLTFVLAAAVPKLELIISLIGALCSSCLALIFPPIIEIATLWEEQISKKRWFFISIKNTLIIVFGFTGFVTGTYVSLLQIVTAF